MHPCSSINLLKPMIFIIVQKFAANDNNAGVRRRVLITLGSNSYCLLTDQLSTSAMAIAMYTT